jgi:DNA polymerase III psi subunit
MVSQEGIRIDPNKTQAISQLPTPKNQKQLKSVLRMCSFFRRYIQNYSILIHPLKQLLKQEAVWVWTKDCDRSFELLKKKLVESPVLATFDQEKPIEVHVDASKVGLGAVLMQKHGKH